MKYCFLFFCTVSLFASFEENLKPALGKEGSSSPISGIDFIYMINLDQRPEKFAHSLQELEPFGIVPYRFSAVNGWEISLQNINGCGIKPHRGMKTTLMGTYYDPSEGGLPHHEKIMHQDQYYLSHCMSRGAVGIVLSHLSIIKDALESGYETIWIMEDDIEVIDDPFKLEALLAELQHVSKGGWDIFFTDRDTKNQKGEYAPCHNRYERPNYAPDNLKFYEKRKNVSDNLRTIGGRFGAYSYILHRSGMEKIWKFYKKYQVFLPYDLDIFLINDFRIYTVRKDIVSTMPIAPSDNGGPNYQSKI